MVGYRKVIAGRFSEIKASSSGGQYYKVRGVRPSVSKVKVKVNSPGSLMTLNSPRACHGKTWNSDDSSTSDSKSLMKK